MNRSNAQKMQVFPVPYLSGAVQSLREYPEEREPNKLPGPTRSQ
jgi:hypothetical protein